MTRIVDSARFGKRYTLLPPGTWTMAMSRAAQMGAQLVTIESQEENDFIRDQVLTFDGAARSAWIGLSDSAVEGQFRWMNGSTASYRNWSPGEPNESNGGEDCVEMYSTGRWNDLFSYAAYPFTVVQTVLPAPACPADVGSAGGVEGPDGVLDNNDFIVFVERLFRRDGRSDVGADGGAAGSDGRWDGNDFIVFVGQFFQGCP
ncbi:MAG: C-type lectin domain-containing protein [Phycisphaerales bacterium]|nr:C-type lectin domain-containing protein [Phycisphaerales bacterium]